jgi:hypothetical protein
VTPASALLLLKRSRFELPKIHAHFFGESKNSENSVLGDISFQPGIHSDGCGDLRRGSHDRVRLPVELPWQNKDGVLRIGAGHLAQLLVIQVQE